MRVFFGRAIRIVILSWAVVVTQIWAGAALAAETPEDRVLVFAASSLSDALTELADVYAKAGHDRPELSFAASSVLARQIENGAPASLYISADEQWMDYVVARKLTMDGTRASFLGNALVLIAPADRPIKIEIIDGFPLARALDGGKLAMGDPDSVPAGKYAKAALEKLGVWRAVEPSVIRADNVRVGLAFVERGEAAAGIVYETDAALARNVTVVGRFPDSSYPAISYPVAMLAGHDSPAARAFYTFLLSDSAKVVFMKYGFRSL